MFRKLIPVLAALALVLGVACKKDKKDGTKDPEASAGTTGTTGETGTTTDPAPTKDPKQNPTMLNDMKNCPSAVKGASTEVTKNETAVMVAVTSDDEAAVAEIRKRAAAVAKTPKTRPEEIKHTGGGTGGGLGKCPIVGADGAVAVAETDSGATITLTPKDAGKVVELYTMSAERAASMNKRGGVAHGTGASMRSGMGNGGNNMLKHKGKRSGAHGSGTGGGGGKGTSKNPCGGKAKNPCGGAAKNPCGGKAKNPCATK